MKIARTRRSRVTLIAAAAAAVAVVTAWIAVPSTGNVPPASASGISKDASAPAAVLKANSTAGTETTASFSPPAGSLVVIAENIVYNRNTTSGPVITAKDSHNSSYAAGPSVYDNAAEGTYVFSRYYAAAPGATTVTVTRTVKTGAAMLELDTWVLDGAAASQAGAASATHFAHGVTSCTSSVTTTTAGSWALTAAAAGSSETLTASGLTSDHVQADPSDGASSGAGHAVTGTPGAETAGWTGPSSTYYSWAALEVLPAAGSQAPAVTTAAATGVTSSAATLNGTVNPEGQAATYHFEYGPTTAYGTSVPVPDGSAGSGSAAVAENAGVTGLTAGTAYHYRLDAANGTGTANGPDQQFTTSAASGLLTWSPPECGGSDGLTCTDLTLTDTGSNQNPALSSNVDYRIHLPASGPLTGGLQIRGGHNVQIIGGEIDLTFPCSDSSSACHGINISKSSGGEVYIEGVLIHDPDISQATGASCPGGGMSCSTGDGIDVDELGTSTPSDIVLQNDRIDGISGCSGGSDHADVFQPYDAMSAHVNIDHLTGTTNCQGLQIDPDLAWGTYGVNPAYTIKNANMDTLNNPYSGNGNRYQYWLTFSTACESGPISLANVYAQEPDGTLNGNSVWPDTDQPAACKSVWSAPALSFPASPQISGVITQGLPPGGDYVPAGVAGTGYVSPGYQ